MDVVKVTDIPMDGNMYYFPQADGQAIYAKKFLPNGQTQILAFKPISDNEPSNVSTEIEKSKFDTLEQFLEGIQNEVRTLSDKIDKISKPTNAKKEAENE
jgi:archaellum component FlaC